jgi:hypothetical protein
MSEQIRISQLPVANTVSDTTVIPVVQDGTTQQATLAVVRAAIGSDTGDITFDATTISAPDESAIVVEARNESGVATARLTLDPDESIAKLESSTTDNTSFSTNNGYGTAEWTVNQFGDGVLIISDARDLYEFIESSNTSWDRGSNKTFSWNGGDQQVEFTGYSWNDQENELTLTVGSENLPPEDPTEVTLITLNWINLSRISVDSLDNEEIQILGRGIPVRINTTDRLNVDADDIRLYSRANDESYIRLYAGDYVRIRTNDHPDSSGTKTWEFTPEGNLELPLGGTIAEGVVTDNPTIELTPADPNTSSQRLIIKGGFGPEDNHLHLTTGDLGETSIFLGTDEHNVRTTTFGSVEITTPDGEGGTNVWQFAGDGTTYLARNTVSPISYLSTPQNDDNIDLELQVGKDFYINTAEFGDNTRKTWKFDTSGSLTFPDDSVQTTAFAGSSISNGDSSVSIPDADGAVVIAVSANDSAMTQHEWQFETGGDLPGIRGPSGAAGFRIYSEELVQIGAQSETDDSVFLAQPGEAYVAVGNTAGTTFLTVNSDGVAVTSIGNSVPNLSVVGNITGGNINTEGSVSATGTITGGNLSTAGTVSATGNVTANNISTGNVVATRVQNGGNLEIRSNVAGTPRTWTFDAIGDFNLPVGGNISGSGYVTAVRVITDPRPLANLTPVAGGRAFVSDGNLVAAGNFGVEIGGGGANTVPVYSDGTNWYIG